MTENLTLETIARLANVSRSTVSRVINNSPKVSAEVRRRVMEIIARTGYQPDAAARSLATRRSGIIGLVIPRAVQALFTDPYYALLIQGIAQGCNAHDYTLSLYLFHTEDEEQKLYPRVLRNQLVDGIIITGSLVNDPLLPQLVEHRVPCVMVGRPPATSELSFVDTDNVAGAYLAASHLSRLGYERIATITGPITTTVGLDRRQGYLNALNDRNHGFDEGLVAEGDFTEAGGYFAMRRLLPRRPEAVFVASDMMALGALRALREASLAVPGDVAIIGFDDLPAAAYSDPPLTTIRQPIRQAGTQAVEVLLDILNNQPQSTRRVTLATDLIIRVSCGSLHRDQATREPVVRNDDFVR